MRLKTSRHNLNKILDILKQVAGNLTDAVEKESDIRALKAQKIKLVPISSQPTYKALLDYSFECCKDEIVVISNSDIYFDKTLSCVVGKEEVLKANKQLLAVSRTGAEECPDRVSFLFPPFFSQHTPFKFLLFFVLDRCFRTSMIRTKSAKF